MNKYWGTLFLMLSTLDLGIKQYVEETFTKTEKRNAVISKVELRKIHNRGFCLDTFDKYPALVKSVSVALCGVLGVKAYQLFQKRGRWREKLGITILGAGAFSNTFDRIVRGYVVDYFGMKTKNSKLSKITANLADVYIFVGGIILAILHAKDKK